MNSYEHLLHEKLTKFHVGRKLARRGHYLIDVLEGLAVDVRMYFYHEALYFTWETMGALIGLDLSKSNILWFVRGDGIDASMNRAGKGVEHFRGFVEAFAEEIDQYERARRLDMEAMYADQYDRVKER